MWKRFTAENTRNWINMLDKLLLQYNNKKQPLNFIRFPAYVRRNGVSVNITPTISDRFKRGNVQWFREAGETGITKDGFSVDMGIDSQLILGAASYSIDRLLSMDTDSPSTLVTSSSNNLRDGVGGDFGDCNGDMKLQNLLCAEFSGMGDEGKQSI